MYKLNGINSPMCPLEENLNDTEAVRLKKIEFIKLREISKSPHCIGSINDIETRVLKLEKQIQNMQSNNTWLYSDSEEEHSENETNSKEVRNEQREKREVAQFAGVFSVVSTYGFNKSERIKKIAKRSLKNSEETNANKDKKTLPTFIELCEYPGFDIIYYTSLPYGITPELILRKVYQAQPNTFIISFRTFFEKWFLSDYMKNILMDIFWFFFIAKYGSDLEKNDLQKFFTRTASNYVNFLFQISKEPLYYQEKLKKKLPNLMSQLVYAALSECFPDSWIQFDEDFIERIILLVYFWFAGIKCTNGIWRKWNMQELKPSEQKFREKVIEEQSKLGYIDYNNNKKIDEKMSFEKKEITKSTFTGPFSHSRCVLLNLNGRSPLVQYHLQNNNVNTSVGTNYVIKHTDLIPVKRNDNSQRYSEIISRSLKEQKSRIENFKKSQEQNAVDMKKLYKTQKITNLDNERKQEKLLTNKKVVHNLSNIMLHEYLKDKDSISFNVDAIIRDTIAALN